MFSSTGLGLERDRRFEVPYASPELLGKTATVESTGPESGATVNLTVTPERVECVHPADARISFLLPDSATVQKDVVNTFCHFVHFFPPLLAGESWASQHAGTFILSIDEAHAIARRKNEAQYGGGLL